MKRERGVGAQWSTKTHKHKQTCPDCYLYDGCGVGRGEDGRVVVNVRDVDVKGDGGGHGRRATVERLH